MSAPEQNPQSAVLTSIGELVTAIDHVGIAVPDLEAAKAWYLDNLGLVCLHEETNEAQASSKRWSGLQAPRSRTL